ncbi:serine palmitoyltransferase component [Quaeritorhiza haematococci]|nr:serine palmitoyltransferase component [Quaeritorhiza haematococci]
MAAAAGAAAAGAAGTAGATGATLPLVNEAAKEFAYNIVIAVNTTFSVANSLYSAIPGSNIIYKYIKDSHQNDPFRTLLELGLVVFMLWYFVHKRYKAGANQVVLTEKEIEELCQEWEPEPLVAPLTDFQKAELEKLPVTQGPAGPRVKLQDGKERLNLAGFDFLGLLNRESTKEKAIQALRKHGVGTCGPPGFYGTFDVHMELEKEIARFIGTEAAIIYSQGFSTIASAIPAFAKRGDLIVADEGVNLAIQMGLKSSRSVVKYFKHNDMNDLERVLEEIKQDCTKKKANLTRQFLVVEGLYVNHGDVAPLPRLIELKKKYKYRLIVEESLSFGVLGPRGAGLADFYGVSAKDVDIVAATMSNALGAAGGFVCGSNEIVEHQRLSGLAYTFSASLPAMLAVSAIEGLKALESESDVLLTRLRENAATFRATVLGLGGAGAKNRGSGEVGLPGVVLEGGWDNEDGEGPKDGSGGGVGAGGAGGAGSLGGSGNGWFFSWWGSGRRSVSGGGDSAAAKAAAAAAAAGSKGGDGGSGKGVGGGGGDDVGTGVVPMFHLRLKNRCATRDEEEKILQEIVDQALRDGVLITRSKYCATQELSLPTPSIRVTVSAGHTKKEVEKAGGVIREAVRRVMRNRR